LPRGHTALAFVDVGVGFADRAAVVVVVGFSQDLCVLRISICITPETISTLVNTILYADDQILMATSEDDLQTMAYHLNLIARKYITI